MTLTSFREMTSSLVSKLGIQLVSHDALDNDSDEGQSLSSQMQGPSEEEEQEQII